MKQWLVVIGIVLAIGIVVQQCDSCKKRDYSDPRNMGLCLD